MAGVIKPVKYKNGEGIDFSDKTLESNAVYAIGNLKSQTTNPPVDSGAAVLYYKLQIGGIVWDLVVGVDTPLMYGRYSVSSSIGTWNKLL